MAHDVDTLCVSAMRCTMCDRLCICSNDSNICTEEENICGNDDLERNDHDHDRDHIHFNYYICGRCMEIRMFIA